MGSKRELQGLVLDKNLCIKNSDSVKSVGGSVALTIFELYETTYFINL